MMTYKIHERRETPIAEITSVEKPINTSSEFLDIAANIPAKTLIIHEHMLDKSFFNLQTGTAGEILQKVSMYRLRLGILGSFKKYPGKSLREFILESNSTRQVLFNESKEEILEIFSNYP